MPAPLGAAAAGAWTGLASPPWMAMNSSGAEVVIRLPPHLLSRADGALPPYRCSVRFAFGADAVSGMRGDAAKRLADQWWLDLPATMTAAASPPAAAGGPAAAPGEGEPACELRCRAPYFLDDADPASGGVVVVAPGSQPAPSKHAVQSRAAREREARAGWEGQRQALEASVQTWQRRVAERQQKIEAEEARQADLAKAAKKASKKGKAGAKGAAAVAEPPAAAAPLGLCLEEEQAALEEERGELEQQQAALEALGAAPAPVTMLDVVWAELMVSLDGRHFYQHLATDQPSLR